MTRKPYKKKINQSLAELKPHEKDRTNFSLNPEWDFDEEFWMIATDTIDDLKRKTPENFATLAFRDAGLDPANPFDWFYLLNAFAGVHYHSGKRTRNRLTPEFESQLFLDLTKQISKQTKVNITKALKTIPRRPIYDGIKKERLRDIVKELGWRKEKFKDAVKRVPEKGH